MADFKYECKGCSQILHFSEFGEYKKVSEDYYETQIVRYCPVCQKKTTWRTSTP